ncbi:hypothetical protein SOX05_08455 [Pseudomonas putida]|nr:hypothetical protein [Pseudomonas putida]MDY4319291.1 hypothetical protein [Pseudomonas putida]MDY4352676.1 hypothetical protein [Pseudomonas putida]
MKLNVKFAVGDSRVALASRMWEVIDINQYLSEVFGSAYKITTDYKDDGDVLCSLEPLTNSFKRYDFGLLGSAYLAAQLITLYRNPNDLATAAGLVKALNVLDELHSLKSVFNSAEYNYTVLMGLHRLHKIRQDAGIIIGE